MKKNIVFGVLCISLLTLCISAISYLLPLNALSRVSTWDDALKNAIVSECEDGSSDFNRMSDVSKELARSHCVLGFYKGVKFALEHKP